MSKPGRNDPCYCGSGEKYKKCHMAADKAVEQEHRQLADAARWLRRDFLRFAREEQFAESFAIGLALYWNNLYNIENAEEMSENEAFRFFDWFVFDFQYGDQPRLIDVYHTQRYEDLSVPQQKILDNWVDAPPASAYELQGYDGQLLHVKEFITAEAFDVYEPTGHGLVQAGDLLLGRLVPVQDQLEFSTVAAYLPQDEIADLPQKMEKARLADAEEHSDASYEEFMRRKGFLIIHHALEQAELKGRPPVAARDPNRADHLARKATRRLRKLQHRL